jgi:hypothetical protein
VAPDAGGLNVAPDTIGKITAEWLDQVASSTSDSVIDGEAGNLTDLKDEVFWRSGQGGTALDATDVHSVPADPVFALKTTSVGALVLCTTAAQLTLAPPGRATIGGLNIPGYYLPTSPAGLTSAVPGAWSSSPPTSRRPGMTRGTSSPTSPASPPAASQAASHSRQETGFHCANQAEPRPTAADQQASRPQTRATCQAPGGGSRPGLKAGVPNGGRR